jgi:hypothetical protein
MAVRLDVTRPAIVHRNDLYGYKSALEAMPEAKTVPRRRYGRDKRQKLFLLTPEMIRLLESAAQKYHTSQTAYLEAALEERFKRDQLLPSFD